MRKFLTTLLCLALMAAMAVPACAIEYSFDAPSGPAFAKPTSIQPVITADRGEMQKDSTGNPTQWLPVEKEEQGSEWSFRRQAETELSGLCDDADVSKDTALIPPAFGSASASVLGTGTPLTPNTTLTAGAVIGGMIINSNTVATPTTQPTVMSFTPVTPDLSYSGGHLGTLCIPTLGVNVKIYEGTDAAQLAKGAGHFEETSIWSGNVALAAHNRGVNAYFGQIHTLNVGDKITLTTKLGIRTYEVVSVSKVVETDCSGLALSASNILTLYTCVRDQSAYRWCVTAREVG